MKKVSIKAVPKLLFNQSDGAAITMVAQHVLGLKGNTKEDKAFKAFVERIVIASFPRLSHNAKDMIYMMLGKPPASVYQKAKKEEMIAELRRWQAGLPTLAQLRKRVPTQNGPPLRTMYTDDTWHYPPTTDWDDGRR